MKTPGSLFNKITGLMAGSFLKKRIQHRCFSMNTAKSFEKHLQTAASENKQEK